MKTSRRTNWLILSFLVYMALWQTFLDGRTLYWWLALGVAVAFALALAISIGSDQQSDNER
jgi:hypothetical protein